MKKKFIGFIFILVFLVLFIGNVYAQESFISKTKSKIISYYHVYSDKLLKVAGLREPAKGETLFGMTLVYGGAWFYFKVGLTAGLFLYIAYLILSLVDSLWRLSAGRNRRKDNTFDEGKVIWFGLVAGNLWKVLVIAVLYCILMQIPLVNRILGVITLDLFLSGFWKKAVILSLEIGFIPSLFEYYWKSRISALFLNARNREAKLRALADSQGSER